ncbi:MAG: methyltransferase domain-containing protein [Pseudomonadota bacterium]
MTRPTLFDAAARARAQTRARRVGFADVLHREGALEVQERLALVNKTFTAPAIVGAAADVWAEVLGIEARQVAEAEVLGLEAEAQDLVISGLHLHAENDPVGQLIQMRRALRPDGLLLAALFGGRSLRELRGVLTEAEAELRGGVSPRVHPMAEIRDVGGLLQRAGFALPVADTFALTLSYESLLHLMRDLRAMGEVNTLFARSRAPLRRDVLMRAAQLYAERHSDADGRVTATVEMIVLTGWAPSDTQQKPLKPGSAKHSLAEALTAFEMPEGSPKSDHSAD